jgi:hypothetical protein
MCINSVPLLPNQVFPASTANAALGTQILQYMLISETLRFALDKHVGVFETSRHGGRREHRNHFKSLLIDMWVEQRVTTRDQRGDVVRAALTEEFRVVQFRRSRPVCS